jgi:hypothetical protein
MQWGLVFICLLAILLIIDVRWCTRRVEKSLYGHPLLYSRSTGAFWLFHGFTLFVANGPLCKLEVFDWGIRLALRWRWLRWLLPDTSLQWSQIQHIEASGSYLGIVGTKGFPRINIVSGDAVAMADAMMRAGARRSYGRQVPD